MKVGWRGDINGRWPLVVVVGPVDERRRWLNGGGDHGGGGGGGGGRGFGRRKEVGEVKARLVSQRLEGMSHSQNEMKIFSNLYKHYSH